MISGIIKVEVSVVSRGLRPRLITLAETLITPDITKTEFKYCFIIHCCMENVQKLLCEMQMLTVQVLTPFNAKGVLGMRTVHGIICTYNWMADYTVIMLVRKIM